MEGVRGIRPTTWLCAGRGVQREDLKTFLFEQQISFVSQAVIDTTTLCLLLTGYKEVMSFHAMRDAVRILLSERRIFEKFPVLCRMRRTVGGLDRITEALDARLLFAHASEYDVFEEYLAERGFSRSDEFRHFVRGYEAFCEQIGRKDSIMLMREACLKIDGWEKPPERIFLVQAETREPLEMYFWQKIATRTQLEFLDRPQVQAQVQGEIWHTLDDAAHAFAHRLAGERLRDHAIVLPDDLATRRTLMRALVHYGIPLLDPRDPTALRYDESMKRSLAAMRVVAYDARLGDVISWKPELKQKLAEIGFQRGLHLLRKIDSDVDVLVQKYPSRLTFQAFRTEGVFFDTWLQDIIEPEALKPLLYWVRELESRIASTKPPPLSVRPVDGVQLFRLSQVIFAQSIKHVWIFGLDARWLEEGILGDAWFLPHERDVLEEFGVRGRRALRAERHAAIDAWMHAAPQCTFLDAHYAGWIEKEPFFDKSQECGAFYYPEKYEPQAGCLRLGPLPDTLSASFVDQLSICAFRGIARVLWKLSQYRPSGLDLWAETRGIFLHEAVRRRNFGFMPTKGLIASTRLAAVHRKKLRRIYDAFLQQEEAYQKRSLSTVLETEMQVTYLVAGHTIRGSVDRVDQHRDGLVIWDYKTSSSLATGRDMRAGVSLQLACYALALRHVQPIVAMGFILLHTKGGRNTGLFFKKWNGKAPCCMSDMRSMRNLFDMEPDAVLSELQQHVESLVQLEQFEAKPRLPSLCYRCEMADLCGARRRGFFDEAL